MHRYINMLKGKALSGNELIDLLGGKVKIVRYPNIHKYKTIDELLEPYGSTIILYELRKNYGHWVCIMLQHVYRN